MKRLLSSKKMYRVFYLFGFVMLMAGMLLSMASVPAQASYSPQDAGKSKPTARAPRVKKAKLPVIRQGTEFPTATPTEAGTVEPTREVTAPPSVTPMVAFGQGDTAVCQIGGGPLSASVHVTLPAGMTAILQTAWKVAEPADLRTSEVYTETSVSNGDTVSVTGQWPGVRATDSVVEIHLGAILLDAATKDPISAGRGIDYYWYSWFCPVGAPATAVPTEVPTMVPTEVVTEVPTLVPTLAPTEVETEVPTMVPTEVMTEVPTMVPTEVMTEVPTTVPTEVMTEVPTMVPTEIMTEVPTMAPTTVPVGGGVTIQQPDTAVCQMNAGPLSAQVKVVLPSGVTSAILQTAWKIAEPIDLRTSEVYTETTVTDGQIVTVTGQWPGVRATDQVVEVHLGAILLDATTRNPLSDGRGIDFYWYPWYCPFAGAPTETMVPTATVVPPVTGETQVPPTVVPPTEVPPTQVPVNVAGVEFVTQNTPLCQMTASEITAQVRVTLPVGMTAILQTAWKVAEPADLRAGENYNQVTVKNGDVITITGQWPGVRSFDEVVEVHFGAILLDAVTHNPISVGVGMDYYWNPSVCPFTGATAVPVPTTVPPVVVTPMVKFTSESKPICMMNAGTVDAQVMVVLPEGVTATLQTAWKVSEPADLRTEEHYNKVSVVNGDVVTITAMWPGVRANDQVVSVHFGAILLDSHGNPLAMGTGIDYYWYSWVCPFEAPVTPVPTEVVTTPMVGFTGGSQALCMMASGPISMDVKVSLPEGQTAYLQTAWNVVYPEDLKTDIVYDKVLVKNGDVITITAMWPGVRATDDKVEVHFGARLLAMDGVTSISDGAGVDAYWYTWVCPVTVTTPEASLTLNQPVSPSLVDVLSGWWHDLFVRMGWAY